MLSPALSARTHAAEPWTIVVGKVLAGDEAVKVALADLVDVGPRHGLAFVVTDDAALPEGNVLLVGAPSRNSQTARLVSEGTLTLKEAGDDQG